MISSVFGKTKPINTVLVLSFLAALFLLSNWWWEPDSFNLQNFPLLFLTLAILLLSVLLMNFVVQRNQLTAAHSYAQLFFVLYFALFSEVLRDSAALAALFFCLLALRRLISMHSLRGIAAKVFDATLWILVSSLFVNWTLILLPLPLIYLYFYEPKEVRNWLVPLAAIITFVLIGLGVSVLTGDVAALWNNYDFSDLRFWTFPDWKETAIRQGGFMLLVLVSMLLSFLKMRNTGSGRMLSLRLISVCLLLSAVLGLFWRPWEGAGLLFVFFPAAVFMSRYLETVRKVWLRDLLLWSVIALMLGVFMADAILK